MRKYLSIFTASILVWSSLSNPTIAASQSFGANISDTNGTIFTITQENNTKVRRPYTSAGAFLSFSFNSWSNVAPATSDDLAIPIGTLIPPRDGSIICSDRGGDKGTCYLITEGKRAAFTNSEVFKKLGYDFQFALSGDVSFLNSSNNIDSDSQAHKPGTLINKNGTVYFVSPTGLLGIPDWTSLLSWGYGQKDIVTANLSDNNLAVKGNLANRQQWQLSPNNTESEQTSENQNSSMAFEEETMPDGDSTKDYKHTFEVKNGKTPYKYEIIDTTHPCCYMGIDKKTGVFSNSKTQLKPLKGNWDVKIKVTDATGQTLQKTFSWQVNYSTKKWSTSTLWQDRTATIQFKFSDGKYMANTAVEINDELYTTNGKGRVIYEADYGEEIIIRYGWSTTTLTAPTLNSPITQPVQSPAPIFNPPASCVGCIQA